MNIIASMEEVDAIVSVMERNKKLVLFGSNVCNSFGSPFAPLGTNGIGGSLMKYDELLTTRARIIMKRVGIT